LNLALFDVDTLAQAVMRAVRDGDAASLAGYSTRRCRTCGAMHDAGGPALTGAIPPDDGARQARQTV